MCPNREREREFHTLRTHLTVTSYKHKDDILPTKTLTRPKYDGVYSATMFANTSENTCWMWSKLTPPSMTATLLSVHLFSPPTVWPVCVSVDFFFFFFFGGWVEYIYILVVVQA